MTPIISTSARRALLVGAIAMLLFSARAMRAQDTLRGARTDFTTEGREFWVVFQKNFRDMVTDEQTQGQRPAHPLQLELFITASKTARGTIEIKGLGYKRNFVVQGGRVANFVIDSAAQLRSSEKIEDLAVHIVSDEPVAVYGLNRRYQTTDTYLAHPVNVLGKVYRVMGYAWLQDDLLSQFAVIATENNTRVRITPSTRTQRGRPAGEPFEVILNRGDAYQVIPKFDPGSSSDLTGTLIDADKPIAVFSGHNCAYVPDKAIKACNLLVEQLPAIQSWGRQFFVGTLAGRSSSVFRVLASEDNTQVFVNGELVATLKAGAFYENKNQTSHVMISSNNPVLVAQYSKGYDNGDDVGDPMMIVVAPTEQFLSAYRFATPVRGAWHHYINLIVPSITIRDLKLDGKPIDVEKFRQLGLSRYSIAQVEVEYGTHVLTGSEPFGLYSYGFGYDESSYDAYGNGGGQSMDIVIELPDTTAPSMDIRPAAGRGLLAIARDDRINDRGLDEVSPIDYDNFTVTIPEFERGTPTVAISLQPTIAKQNGYALFRLRDRAGNSAYYTICASYDEAGDSMIVKVLTNGQGCDFAGNMQIGGFLKYMILNNDVTIAAGSAIGNPVPLVGNFGSPSYGFGGYIEYPWKPGIYLTGRAEINFLTANAFGYWPDSLQRNASDGTRIVEEFKLKRVGVVLGLAPGIQYYYVERRAHVFGLLNISLPVVTSETLTREILSSGNSSTGYVYQNGTSTLETYSGGGPSGFAIGLTPEAGLGISIDFRMGWRFFGELGAAYALTSISPDRDWHTTYYFSRMGAKVRF